jgi:protein-S-isoprenylcysteine O-methyltransferase Ste14
MRDEDFRTLLVIITCCFAPMAMYFRHRSFATREKLDRSQEGAFILYGLRLGAIPFAVGCLMWAINPQWLAWAKLPLPTWLRCTGLGIYCLWGLLHIWTFKHLGKNLTDTVVTRKDATLVTSGPYRFVRHPFYLSFALAIIGGSLASANWFLFVTACVPLAFLVVRTRTEEAKLIERFGDDYRSYMTRTGRFVPWW